MDAMGEGAFHRNSQCALINANNPFMAGGLNAFAKTEGRG